MCLQRTCSLEVLDVFWTEHAPPPMKDLRYFNAPSFSSVEGWAVEAGVAAGSIRANLAMGRRRIEVLVCMWIARDKLSLEEDGRLTMVSVWTSTARTRLSCPVKTLTTLPMTQWLVKAESSVIMTMSPIWRLGLLVFHFPAFWRCWRYSPDHLRQKWWRIAWQSVHRLCK